MKLNIRYIKIVLFYCLCDMHKDETNADQDFYSVLIPIARSCQIFGILPLWLKGVAGKRKYSTSYIMIFYNVTLLALSMTGMYMRKWTISENIRTKHNDTYILATMNMEFIVAAWSTGVMIVSSIIARDQFASAIDTLCSQDTVLRKLGSKLDYTADLKFTCIRFGIYSSVTTAVFVYDFYQSNFNLRYPSNWAAWMYPNFIRIISTCLYSDVLFALRRRILAVNKHLVNMIEETKYPAYRKISTMVSKAETLRSIARVHEALYEVALKINGTFGMNMIIGAVYALKVLAESTNCILQEILYHFANIRWMHMTGCLNRVIISCAHIVYMVTVCTLVKKQANLTGKLIHKFHIVNDNTPFNDVLRSLSLQLYHKKIEFSAAGVCPLDATLLQTIVGAVTTFLVMLMQFDSSVPG